MARTREDALALAAAALDAFAGCLALGRFAGFALTLDFREVVIALAFRAEVVFAFAFRAELAFAFGADFVLVFAFRAELAFAFAFAFDVGFARLLAGGLRLRVIGDSP